MIECGSASMCTNRINLKWFHTSCVNSKHSWLEKREYYYTQCMQRRGRGDELPKGMTKVAQPPPAAWCVPEGDALPDVKHVKEQFWCQAFRTRIRQNALLEGRPLSEVNWAEYPSVSECIQHDANATESQIRGLQDFALKFVCSLNTRLAHKNDIFTLEALTLFDPRINAKEHYSTMRSKYLEHLLTRSGVSPNNCTLIRSACANWFQLIRAGEFGQPACRYCNTLGTCGTATIWCAHLLNDQLKDLRITTPRSNSEASAERPILPRFPLSADMPRPRVRSTFTT